MILELVMGRVDHMLPHFPTQEMVDNHPWHVYVTGNLMYIDPSKPQLVFTGTRAECRAYIERVSSKSVIP